MNARSASKETAPEHTPADLVLEGGGVKGIATAGAVTELARAGYRFERVAGTSVGAIAAAVLAALSAAGKDVSELPAIMSRLELAKVPDRGPLSVPLANETARLLTHNGLYSSDYVHGWLRDELARLNVHTFGDLRRADPGADRNLALDRRYRLVVMATDVTHGRLLRLPWDYPRLYGLDPDEQLVADAVRMSLSIPLYFEPQHLTDTRRGERSVIVDGGVLSNFPIEIFDRTDGERPRWETIGIRLFPDLPAGLTDVSPVFGLPLPPPIPLLTRVLVSALVGRDQTHLEQPGVRDRTIAIDTSGFGITEFSLSGERRAELVARGAKAAQKFLASRASAAEGAGAR